MGQKSSTSRDVQFSLPIASSPSAASFFTQLADVELQSIMHCLLAKDLIKFARCNKQLLHAADSSFAWKYSLLKSTCGSNLLTIPSATSLLRHACLSILFVGSNEKAQMNSLRPLLRPRSNVIIREVDAWLKYLSDDNLRLILTNPTVFHLQTLRLYLCESSTMTLLATLPDLRTLSIRQMDLLTNWESMGNLHSITSLHIGAEGAGPATAALASLDRCIQLNHLTISNSPLQGPQFLTFIKSPTMRLQSLQLDCLFANEIPSSTLAVLVGSNLYSLHLSRCWGIDSLLQLMTSLPISSNLHRLILQPCCSTVDRRELPSVPFIPIVNQILSTSPQLECIVILRPYILSISERKHEKKNAMTMKRLMEDEVRVLPNGKIDRFRIQDEF